MGALDQFKTKRLLPTPRLSSDDYYRYALVPRIEQRQSGVAVGAGIIGRMEAAARLVRTSGGGIVDYSLVFPKGE